MGRRARLVLGMAAGGFLWMGCEDAMTEPRWSVERAGAPAIGVMTWNVYVGAEIEAVLAEPDPTLVPLRVAEAYAAVGATSFAERAEAIAAAIERHRPAVVGLQEVSVFRLQSPGDVLAGNPVPATEVALDYGEILLEALAGRGLDYRVAARNENFDLEVPMFVGPESPLADIRLTDYDLILTRADVATSGASSGTFQAALPVSLGGAELRILRGWAAIDVEVKETRFRVLNTHLEPADQEGTVVPELAALQSAQLAELMAVLDGGDGPTILLGDLNSAADGSTTESYASLLAAGFVDAWTVGRPRGDGFTASQDPGLRNPVSELYHRIDYVLYRDRSTAAGRPFLGSADVALVGADPAERTPSGLWPSDHAGVMAVLRPAPR